VTASTTARFSTTSETASATSTICASAIAAGGLRDAVTGNGLDQGADLGLCHHGVTLSLVEDLRDGELTRAGLLEQPLAVGRAAWAFSKASARCSGLNVDKAMLARPSGPILPPPSRREARTLACHRYRARRPSRHTRPLAENVPQLDHVAHDPLQAGGHPLEESS
jgi:hypothetical protein